MNANNNNGVNVNERAFNVMLQASMEWVQKSKDNIPVEVTELEEVSK
jgi:hypothetical protein